MIWCWWAALLGLLGFCGPAHQAFPPQPHYTTTDRSHGGVGVHLSGKPCSVGRRSGTCLWVQECLRQRGQHIGVCVDGFMFGSCCTIENHTVEETTITTQATSIYRPAPTPSKPYRPSAPQTQTHHGKPPRPHTQRPSFMTKPIDSSMSNSYKPPITTMDESARPSTAAVDKPMTYSSQLGGGKPGRPTNYNVVVSEYDLPRPESAHKPAAAGETSPSNKISSSPSIVVGNGVAPQRGTARPIASITILEEEDDNHNSISSVQWAGRPGSGGNANTLHWQATTEPGFITRPRPSSTWDKPSTGKPKPTKKFTTTTPKSPTTKPSAYQKPSPAKPQYYKPVKTSTKAPVAMSEMEDEDSQNSVGETVSTTTNSPVSTTAATRNTECGVPALFSRPETRIVGGKDAPFGRWPWQVSVRRTSFFGFSSTHRCGGAVLNENWVATAGHCVDDLLTSQIRIRVGEYDFSNVQEDYPYVERGVARKAVHPKYNFFTYEYDLALVRLEQSLVFAPHISPICLPATDDLLVGENATVTGWGRLSEGGTLPSILQEVQVPIVSNDRCKTMFLRAGRHEFIPDIFLCAGHERGGQDSCQGDSGGPLQVKGRDGRYFLAGIISWGIGCAEANLPGICTRISKFVPWILTIVT